MAAGLSGCFDTVLGGEPPTDPIQLAANHLESGDLTSADSIIENMPLNESVMFREWLLEARKRIEVDSISAEIDRLAHQHIIGEAA